jgi:hypothetical protein
MLLGSASAAVLFVYVAQLPASVVVAAPAGAARAIADTRTVGYQCLLSRWSLLRRQLCGALPNPVTTHSSV